MKRILIFIIISISFFACKDEFVDRLPNTKSVTEVFYNTPDDATQALTAVYNMANRDDYWGWQYWEAASDDCAGGAGSGDNRNFQRTDRGIQWVDINAYSDIWRHYWGAIFRANIYLLKEELIDWTGKNSLRLQYQAEARFLRAYYYFYLVRFFGELPYLDKPLSPNEEIPDRTPAEDLFYSIIQDLEFCANNGLSAPFSSMNYNKNWGRATKWSAEAMIGRVYLFYSGYYNDPDIKDFTALDAREYIDDVIKNSGHDLVNNFASLWRVPTYSELGDINLYAGEINPESVWSIRYEVGFNAGQTFHRMIGPRMTNIPPYGNGWGTCTVLPTLWNLYDNNDTRKTATILSWNDEGLVYDWVTNGQAQYTGYNSKKYEIVAVGISNEVGQAGGDWQSDAFEDFMIIRFADVLLMGAELYVITNGDNDGTALGYLNQVRTRAFGNTSSNYTTVSIQDIMLERRLELACEGIRYWDILRSCKGDFSKLADILTYVDNNDGGVDYSNSVNTESLDVDGNNFVATKGLFQIPEDELIFMEGAIRQNEGYESQYKYGE